MLAHIKDNEAAIVGLSLCEDPWRKLCARASNVPGDRVRGAEQHHIGRGGELTPWLSRCSPSPPADIATGLNYAGPARIPGSKLPERRGLFRVPLH
jgi:hypothetical protein